MKSLLFLISTLLLPSFYNAQDWPIKGTKDWPSLKDFNDTCDVIPLGVDFGLCSMALGWGLTDSGCVVLSGCSWIGSNGIDYSSSFFSSSYECNSACLQDTVIMLGCIDSNLINLQVLCPGIYEPVCGCDSTTYENSCIATNYFGVSSFYPGACSTSKTKPSLEQDILVFPNPNDGKFNMTSMPIGSLVRFYNVYGQIVEELRLESSSVNLDLSHLPKGYYLFTINTGLAQKLLIE
ncbi:MAG: T9SS type A sorting domain-containing protein [Flavobacteriales bacterium]